MTYPEYERYKNLIHLKKQRFRCKGYGKIAFSEISLVKKKRQITSIAKKLIEKIPMTTITESLAVSTLTVIRKLKKFDFKTDLNCLPVHMA